MLGFFPTPFEDECFYSLCARYSEVVNYQCPQKIVADMFNMRGASVAIDLPSSLNVFTKRLDKNSKLSTIRIIEDHSLLPYYAPFLPRERVKSLINIMKSTTGEAVHNISGITPTSINRPNKLRFCPSCAIEEENESGILYWHRLHQLPGVLICPKHLCFLEESSANLAKNIYRAKLFSPQNYIFQCSKRAIDLSNVNHQILLSIAKESDWLLKTNIKSLGYEVLEKKYMGIFSELNLVFPDGRIKLKEVRRKFRNYYGNDLLDLIQCNFDDNKEYQWISRIIPHLRKNKVNHPLRHILLIRTLGYNVKSFFSYKPKRLDNFYINNQPKVSNGLFSCRNPVCKDYDKLTIYTYEVKPSSRDRNNSTIFITCHCGFAYYKYQSHEENNSYKTLVTSYGKLWEKELVKLWKKETISINTISKLLGVSSNAIKNRAVSLGLKFPRKGPGPKIATVQSRLQKERVEKELKKKQATGIIPKN